MYYVVYISIALFPGSTPQLFSHRVEKRLFYTGVEPGNKAIYLHVQANLFRSWNYETSFNYILRSSSVLGHMLACYTKSNMS